MLTNVRLSNFKPFGQSPGIDFGRLTVLVGKNSSGKTSLLQPLLFLAQSVQAAPGSGLVTPVLNGPFVQLGDHREYAHRHRRSAVVRFDFNFRVATPPLAAVRHYSTPALADIHYWLALGESPEGDRPEIRRLGFSELFSGALVETVGERTRWKSIPLLPDGSAEFGLRRPYSLFEPFESLPPSEKDQRSELEAVGRALTTSTRWLTQSCWQEVRTMRNLAAARQGPQRFYVSSSDGGIRTESFASRARQAIRIPARSEFLKKWLVRFGIADQLDSDRLAEGILAIRLRDDQSGVVSNLADFGFGASQILPLLVSAAETVRSVARAPIWVIQQPEVHLHPTAQVVLGEFLVDLLATSGQVIVETHSEHIIRVLQRFVATGQLAANDLVILFAQKSQSGTSIERIPVGDDGTFTDAVPQGFLDAGFEEALRFSQAHKS